jgi:hypothetical protein
LLDHRGRCGLDGIPDAEKIDLHLVAEGAGIVDVRGHHADTGVGQDDVEAAQHCHTFGYRSSQRG